MDRLPPNGDRSVEWQESFPENVIFARSSVVFATVHVVGSENDWHLGRSCPVGIAPT